MSYAMVKRQNVPVTTPRDDATILLFRVYFRVVNIFVPRLFIRLIFCVLE